MLNIISGLLVPSQGTVKFDGRDMTRATPQERNIAQVFQFPVIYDTMTVAENLAFPLRNRKVPAEQIRKRVGEIAEMLDMSGQLDQRAAGLAADAKQKISLGRGLVRSDVSAVLFDEPLTVIDPHLKWQLRRKLKQIHRELKLTLIYVTHDQVEALTFAEEVVVMTRGKAVQVGSAEALFERPAAHLRRPLHRLAGHELPAGARAGGTLDVAGTPRVPARASCPGARSSSASGPSTCARRAGRAGAVPAVVTQVQDVGTHVMLSVAADGSAEGAAASGRPRARGGDTVWVRVLDAHTATTRCWA
jgi:glycerol transport system ATP-binding protein